VKEMLVMLLLFHFVFADWCVILSFVGW